MYWMSGGVTMLKYCGEFFQMLPHSYQDMKRCDLRQLVFDFFLFM